MKKIKLSSKAKTLENLKVVLKSANILPIYRIPVNKYQKNKNSYIDKIQSKFNGNIVIRSSASIEDNKFNSYAGAFTSVLNVNIKSKINIKSSIEKVIKSYGKSLNDKDEVFIQSMLNNIKMCGVIFTSDIDTLSPYYIINYDENGSSDAVTGGKSNKLKTFILFKQNKDVEDNKIKKLINVAKECEKIFSNKFLDIEFAFSEGELYIFQVRAIVTKNKKDLSKVKLNSSLKKLYKKIDKLNSPHPNLLGDKAIFGVMPDWNPAEIIGIRPKRLALSLYKELITDETWAYQRDNYGYRNLRSHPLLLSFLGMPFIDARISFNSFIPKSLSKDISTKLVNFYLNELAINTKKHDKIEFEIIFSCYFFGIEKKLNKLKNKNFNVIEIKKIKESLLSLTKNIINPKKGLYKKDLNKIEVLKNKYDEILNSDLATIDRIYWLIKNLKRYGTLPFAGIARAGFIAIQFLNSLVEEKIISKKDYNSYLNSLNTVSKNLSIDLMKLDKTSFLNIYGHLRPGTYDILSPTYDEQYDNYFTHTKKIKKNNKIKEFKFSKIQKDKIEDLLKKNKFNISFDEFNIFIKSAIEGREYSKFVFTKSLSKVLNLIKEFGERFKFIPEDLAYLDIQKVINLYATLDHRSINNIFKSDINKNKNYYQYTKAVKLPSIITKPDDIYSYYLDDEESNFVTLNKISSNVVKEEDILNSDLEGKIICIKSADPGYDYLFSKNIGGLITCYGGANSHMAIRCAEMSIPAVIGCGESKFLIYKSAKNLQIDALNKQVKKIS